MTGGMRGALYWVRAMHSTRARSKSFFVHLEQYTPELDRYPYR